MNTNDTTVERVINGYELVDHREHRAIAWYKPAQKGYARGRADRLNAEWGGYRYSVNPVWVSRKHDVSYGDSGPNHRVYRNPV